MNPRNEDFDLHSIQEKNLENIQKSMEQFCEWIVNESEEKETDTSSMQNEKLELQSEVVLLEWDISETNNQETEKDLIADIDKSIVSSLLNPFVFLAKYIVTAWFIFIVLMLGTNYSAYMTIAQSYLNPNAMAANEANLENTIAVSKIQQVQRKDKKTENEVENQDEIEQWNMHNTNDIRNIIGNIKKEEIQLDIDIIPFVNRLIIPKIGENIPLVDINQGSVEDFDELNNIFMDELKGGVVRYPGSAKPWEYGNAFIFGHSSNFPWVEWDYNDVFVLLDRLEVGDEVVTYYEWQKYVYRIKEKQVISPDDTSVLKRNTGKKEITLMTCWPIGTTYNRLLVIGELVTE